MEREAVRSFIAIELPEEIRRELHAIEMKIQAQAGDSARKTVRWVAANNMHLTLKFLGEVSAANLQILTQAIKEATGRYPAFEFTVNGLGAFPNTRRPRVVWVGVEAPPDLLAIQKAIEAETRRLGYPSEERPFSPHLTLGRTAQNARPEEIARLAHALSEMKIGLVGRVQAEEVILFRSDLRPTGAVYTPLNHFPLQRK
jgi:RNA 2',3'-cyclic 3'-phosphodiesterase